MPSSWVLLIASVTVMSLAACASEPVPDTQVPNDTISLYVIFNAYWEPLDFELPPLPGTDTARWHRWIDTSLDSPHDITDWALTPPISSLSYRAESRSVVALVAK